MSLFMDRHEVPDATPEDVAAAHVSDLAVASKYDIEFISYWFDRNAGAAFCFARAPSPAAMKQVHAESHGLIPAEIIEVSENDVVRFLGKIHDPEDASQITSPFRTIVFTDLEDSTGLLERIGESQFMLSLTEHDLIVRRALVTWSGREVKHTGDGFLLSFVEVADALNWGLGVRDEFARRSDADPAWSFRVRIGMAGGEPVDHDGDIYGAAVNRANRICGVAEPGQVMVDEVVHDLGAGKGFVFGEATSVLLKGFTTPYSVYELDGSNGSGMRDQRSRRRWGRARSAG